MNTNRFPWLEAFMIVIMLFIVGSCTTGIIVSENSYQKFISKCEDRGGFVIDLRRDELCIDQQGRIVDHM